MDLNVNSFVILSKLLDLFNIYIYIQKHTEAIIYLTILSLERIVILYQTSPSLTLFPIIERFTAKYTSPPSSETDSSQSNSVNKG